MLQKMMLLATLAFVAPAAQAQMSANTPCEATVLTYNLRHVTVDGAPVRISGRMNRMAFETWAAKCRPAAAQLHFRKWRAARRGVNWTATGGTLLLWPLYAATVVYGVDANIQRSKLDRALTVEKE